MGVFATRGWNGILFWLQITVYINLSAENRLIDWACCNEIERCLCRLWATWPTTGWPCMKVWTLTLWGKLCGTTSTVCTGYGQCRTLLQVKVWNVFCFLFYFCCASFNVLSLRLCSYDDYDYGSVNVLLERSLKVFVKTMACHPEQTTARVYHAFWRHFRHSEKVGTSSNTTWRRHLQPQRLNRLTF